jgi:hypothetical protein
MGSEVKYLETRVLSLIYLWLLDGSEAQAAIIPWNRRNSSKSFRLLKRKDGENRPKAGLPTFNLPVYFKSSN